MGNFDEKKKLVQNWTEKSFANFEEEVYKGRKMHLQIAAIETSNILKKKKFLVT